MPEPVNAFALVAFIIVMNCVAIDKCETPRQHIHTIDNFTTLDQCIKRKSEVYVESYDKIMKGQLHPNMRISFIDCYEVTKL